MAIVTNRHGRKKSVVTVEGNKERLKAIIDRLTPGERILYWDMIRDEESRDGLGKEVVEHRYHTIPVSMEQFLEDPYYLGDSCDTLWPQLRQDLVDMFEAPYREVILCLHPDTVVPLLDGTTATMGELVDRWNRDEKPIWLYSVDEEQNVVPSKAVQPRYTGEDYYYEVTLDDGSSFVANSRHQMVMRGGEKKMVRDMRGGDSLMPFKRSQNHYVISIKRVGHGPVCCLTVPTYENFAILTKNADGEFDREGVFSSNTGGIGIGKTYSLSIALCRIIYELSCLINPQKTFGLSTATEIVIPLFSKNLHLARQVMKTAIDDKIKESPYFMTKYPPDIKSEYTLFPNNIRVTIGSYGSERILGANVAAVGLDECLRKFSSINIERYGYIESISIGDLMAMEPEEKSNCRIIGFDHKLGKLSSGWWRIKKSTVQEIVSIKTVSGQIQPSRKHPVLVKRGEWLVYDYAENIMPGDFIVRYCHATKRTEVKRRSEEENFRENTSKEDDELEFAGVRPERLRVEDLPSELYLVEVLGTEHLPPEQTYSICTEFETFIADGFVVHNTNFPPKRKAQQITTAWGQKASIAHFDIVEKVYRGVLRRIKSRFQKVGEDFPGMVILASSAATVDSFTDRKLRESKDDPAVFVRDHTPWTAKPKDTFSGECFYLLCSSSSMQARILEEEEIPEITDEFLDQNDSWIIEVPVEFREDFEANMEEALRDIAGISTQAISIFIQRHKAVDECVNSSYEHPFTVEEWTAGGRGGFKWEYLCREVERTVPGGFKEKAYVPMRNPKAFRWIHIDTSVSGDSSGFCMAYVDRWVEVVRRDDNGNKYTDVAPYYIVECMLRINPPAGEQIYLPDLRQLVYSLSEHGYSFIGFSTDSYMYVEMHQQIKRHGIHTELISVDRKIDPYNELKSALYEKRIEIYQYNPFIEEIKTLEHDRNKEKVDHQQGKSKDVADGVAGCIYGLLKSSTKMPLGMMVETKKPVHTSNSWVSRKIPADNLDLDVIEDMKEDSEYEGFSPFIFGED